MTRGLVFCWMLLSGLAQAASPREKKPTPPQTLEGDVKMEVPQSQLELEKAEAVTSLPLRWGILASTWWPQGISIPSYVPTVSDFRRASLPYLALENLQSLALGKLRLDRRFALAYVRLRRSAPAYGKVLGTTQQNLHFFSLPLGLELHVSALEVAFLSPYLQANLAPSVAFTPRSNLEKGTSAFGFFYDAKLGLQAEVKVFDDPADPHYFLNVAGALVGGSLRSSHRIDGAGEAGLQASF